MARQKGSRTGRCQGAIISSECGSSGFSLPARRSKPPRESSRSIITHCARRHWLNHVSVEARAAYIAGAGATKDQLEDIVANESLALIDHYRIIRGSLYKGLSTASEVGDGNALALLAGRLHENLRDSGRLTGELQRGPLLNIQNNVQVNPDYAKVIARIVNAVAPYAEARQAVIAALRDLNTMSASLPVFDDHRSDRVAIDG